MKSTSRTMLSAKAVWGGAMILSLTMATSQAPTANAAMVGTESLSHDIRAAEKREAVSALLARADISSRLVEMGIDPADAEKRVASLSDQEVAAVYEKLDQLPAGSGVLGLIVVILVIFIITDAAGATDIFPGV